MMYVLLAFGYNLHGGGETEQHEPCPKPEWVTRSGSTFYYCHVAHGKYKSLTSLIQ